MNPPKIQIINDSYTAIEDAMLNSYISERYVSSYTGITILGENLEEFLKEYQLKYPDMIISRIEESQHNRTIFMEHTKFFIEVIYDSTSDYNLNLYTESYKLLEEMFNNIKKYEPKSKGVYITLDNIIMDNSGSLQIRKEFKEKQDIIDVSTLYYPYLDTDTLFKKFTLSSENILLLIGSPGTGKTKLVALYEKFMFEQPDYFLNEKTVNNEDVEFNIAYIKNEDILSKDSFWDLLRKQKYTLIFLDDADNCLSSRTEEVHSQSDSNRNKFISNLLSFTDGLDDNKTKFIITTNKKVSEVDYAVLRRGRTFDILEMQSLSNEEAKKIWLYSELPLESFENLFKDNPIITSAELGSEIKMLKRTKDSDLESKEYVLRDGVSILHNFKKRNNIITI